MGNDPSAETAEDLGLMARVAAGESEAQRIVATRLIGRVRRVARSLLRDPADADDATQMGLVAILGSAAAYRGDAPLERWANRIAARTAMHMVRERRRRGGVVDGETNMDDLADPTTAMSGSDRTLGELEDHLAGLNDVSRTTIVLRHVLEYSIDETAELTGVSPNTVKDRLLRARDQLRKLLRREEALDGALAGKGRS